MTDTPLTPKVARGLRWAGLDQVLTQIMRLTVTVVLTRLVAPEDFGLLAMALVFTQLAAMLGDLGFGPALVQRKTIERRHISTASITTISVGLCAALLVALLSGVIAAFYDEPELQAVVLALSATFLLRGISGVPKDLLRRQMEFSKVAIASISSVLVGGSVGIAMALGGAQVSALVAYVLIENVTYALVVCVVAIKAGYWRPQPRFQRQAFMDLAKFGAFVSGGRLAYYGATNVDNLIVGKVLGSSALGFYNLAYRLMLFPILKVADVVANVTTPAFAAVQDEHHRLQSAYRKAVQRIGLVCFPVSAGTVIIAPVLIPALFGSQWLPAVGVVQVLAINGVRLALGRMNGVVFEATGRPQWDFYMLLTTLVLYVGAFLVGVDYGVVGVAWAFTIAGYVLVPIDVWLVHRALKAKAGSLLGGLVPVIGATAGMCLALGVALWALPPEASAVLSTVVGLAVAASTYAVLLRLLMWGDLKAAVSEMRR